MDKRLNKEFSNQAYLQKVVQEAFDNDVVGDDKDRWTQLVESFSLKQQLDVFEEYDGMNDEDAEGLLMVVTFPLLTRGHSIQTHVLSNQYIQVQVPALYYLALGLPIEVDSKKVSCYFDCKIRRLFIHMQKINKDENVIEEVPEAVEDELE